MHPRHARHRSLSPWTLLLVACVPCARAQVATLPPPGQPLVTNAPAGGFQIVGNSLVSAQQVSLGYLLLEPSSPGRESWRLYGASLGTSDSRCEGDDQCASSRRAASRVPTVGSRAERLCCWLHTVVWATSLSRPHITGKRG